MTIAIGTVDQARAAAVHMVARAGFTVDAFVYDAGRFVVARSLERLNGRHRVIAVVHYPDDDSAGGEQATAVRS